MSDCETEFCGQGFRFMLRSFAAPCDFNNSDSREFLIDRAVPFATLRDDHVDDEYAIS